MDRPIDASGVRRCRRTEVDRRDDRLQRRALLTTEIRRGRLLRVKSDGNEPECDQESETHVFHSTSLLVRDVYPVCERGGLMPSLLGSVGQAG